MPIEAKLTRNTDDFTETLEFSTSGATGVRHYRINTDILDLAIYAQGLPKIGDAWSEALPTLCVNRIGPFVRLGGQDTSGDGDGGIIRVTVSYTTPTFGQQAADFSTWTEIRTSITSQNIIEPIARIQPQPEPGQGLVPILEGDGVDVNVGTLAVYVHTYKRKSDPGHIIPLTLVMDLLYPQCKLNIDAMTLPRLMRTNRGLNFRERELLFCGIESINDLGDHIEVVYHMEARADWVFVWQSTDTEGRLATTYEDQIYGAASFAGLW